MNAASAAAAAEFERQELLQRSRRSSSASPISNRARCSRNPRHACAASRFSSTRAATRRTSLFRAPRRQVTYQRERVYRRQTINEKIEEALEEADERNVSVGVDAAMGTQFARRTAGEDDPTRSAYALASADLFFTAGIAQYTDILRRYRRPERIAARHGDSVADAAQRVHGAPGRAEPAQSSRGLAAHGALRTAARPHRGPARPDELLRSERVRQRREHAVPERRARQQPDAGPLVQRHRRRHGVRRQERLPG